MSSTKKSNSLHPRNLHTAGYDFKRLTDANKDLAAYLVETPTGNTSIDFANPLAVFELNKSLLKVYYNIDNWSILKGSLCPAIPGRADYMHYLADLLASDNNGEIPKGEQVKILDIGSGSSAIYPILGQRLYGWSFVGTDIDENAVNHARNIVKSNAALKKQIVFQLQDNSQHVFESIIQKDDHFDAVVCNPPFFKSREENWERTTRKFHNLTKNPEKIPVQNFAGHPNELWCEGGEKQFVRNMIYESMKFKKQLGWITSLISDKDNLKPLVAVLEYNKASKVEIIKTAQGNKVGRILAWKW